MSPVEPNSADRNNPVALQRRIKELESLCADVYEVAVLQGLPAPILTRLWMVAAQGNRPQSFALDPPQIAPLPDVPLVHRLPSNAPAVSPLPDISECKTLMVVEDDPAMLDLLVKILSAENYHIIAAPSGEAALNRLKDEPTLPDLLITDLMMPGIDGRQLAGEFRKRVPTLRVLYQTGFTDALFKQVEELEPGAAFLEKPFTARGLMEAVRFQLFDTLNPGAPPVEDSRDLWRYLDDRSA